MYRPMIDLTDAAVIEQSLGDPEAFGAIFDRHVRSVHAYLARRSNTQAAEGLLGEVFRVAFETRERFQPEHLSCLPWLYGIAANVLRQDFRTGRRQGRIADRLREVRPGPSPAAGTPEDQLAGRELVDRAVAAAARLPEADRETLLLFVWEELSYEEIATALGVPIGTVRSRLHRARTRVREQLTDHHPNDGNSPSTRRTT